MQTNPLCRKISVCGPSICLPGWVEEAVGGESLPRLLSASGRQELGRLGAGHMPHHVEARRLAQRGWPSGPSRRGSSRLKACAGDETGLVWWVEGAERPPPTSLPTLFSPTPCYGLLDTSANRADYSSICSNLKIKTDKVKIFREQCQAQRH